MHVCMASSRKARLPATLIAAMLLAPVGAVFLAHALIADLPAPAASAPSTAVIATAGAVEDRTPEIHGRILDADGKPVNSAAVRLVSPRLPYTVYTEAKSDAAGKFSFAHVGSEPLRVVADHDPDEMCIRDRSTRTSQLAGRERPPAGFEGRPAARTLRSAPECPCGETSGPRS